MSPEKLADIKIAIHLLRSKGTFVSEDRHPGCCHIVRDVCRWDFSEELKPSGRELQDFPKYSGDTSFPVRHPFRGLSPADAYFYKTRWGDHEYGNNRRAYALWLADFLEAKFLT